MNVFKVDYIYRNNIDLLDIVMYLFSKTVLKTELSDKERMILRAYLIHGYSKQVKKGIQLDLGMTEANVNMRNYTLQKKGFLSPHPTSQKLKLINQDLLNMRDCFINNENKKAFLVNFVTKPSEAV